MHANQKDKSSSQLFSLYNYILELSLLSDIGFGYKPSIIAASSMVLAHYCLRMNLWPKKLVEATGYVLSDLLHCSIQLSKDINDIRFVAPELNMTNRRHSKKCRHCVAEIAIPVLASTTTLIAYEQSRCRIR